MKNKRTILSVIVASILLMATFVSLPVVVNAGMPKIVMGWVEQNSTYGVRAWDATQNGDTVFFLQNHRNNGTSTDVMIENFSAGTTDYYSWDAGSDIVWDSSNLGDLGVIIINREDGSGATRAGYVGYTADPITDSVQLFPDCELQKIPVPTMILNGTDFINVTWPALPDPLGLIAGYKIYNSTDNTTWNLAGGTTNAPLTDLYFNNTGLSPGIYYYSVKVVFKGYNQNNTGQVNNYQNAYNGEGSGPISIIAAPPTVDIIIISLSPTGATGWIGDQTYYKYDSATYYACGWNTTYNIFVMLVDVDWTIAPPAGVGTVGAGPATSTTFNAVGVGTCIVTATHATYGTNDTGILTVLPLPIDRIIISLDPTGATGWIGDQTYTKYDSATFYACGWNDTYNEFVSLVDVTWTVAPPTGVGTVVAGPFSSTTFTAVGAGTCVVTATHPTYGTNDTGVLTVNPLGIDRILISADSDGSSGWIGDQYYIVSDTDTFYACGWNDTFNEFVQLETVTWTIVPPAGVGTVIAGPDTFTTFTAVGGGTCIVTATHAIYGTNDTGVLNVSTYMIDRIIISLDSDFSSGWIGDHTYYKYDTDQFYACGWNDTSGVFVKLVDVTWTIVPPAGVGTVGAGPATSTLFTAVGIGTCVVTATHAIYGTNDTGILTVNPLVIDRIEISLDSSGVGGWIGDQSYGVTDTDIYYACGWNDTYNEFVDLVDVTWTVAPPAGVGTVVAGPANSTTFTAIGGGTCIVTATHAIYGTNDTGILTVIITVDQIIIMDAPNNTGNPIWVNYPNPEYSIFSVGDTFDYYAAGFNLTTGLYVQDVSVYWNTTDILLNPDTNNGTVVMGPSISTTLTINSNHGGALFVLAENIGLGLYNTTDMILIIPPMPDEIEIRDAPNRGGNIITTRTYNIGQSDTFYAAGINYTAGYIGDIWVNWTSNAPGIGSVVLGPSDSTTFNAVSAGTCTVTATNDTWGSSNVTGTLTINPLEVDQIIIMDAPGGTGNPIWVNWPLAEYSIFSVGDTFTYYAAGFNLTTGNYIQDVSVYWNTTDILLNPDTNNGTVVLGPSISTTLTINSNHGGALFVVAENIGLGLYNTTDMILIIPPMPDEIEIRDAPNRGGSIVGDKNYNVGQSATFYAAGINYTAGYIGDVWVNWTSNAPGIGSVVLGPSDSTTFNAVSAGTCIVTATNDTWGSSNVTGTLTISAVGPTVSYITIRDAAGGLGNEVTDRTYSVEDIDHFYVAAYATGGVYLYDVEVAWTITPSGVGDIDTSIGLQTNFTALEVPTDSTCTVTATYSTFTDSTGTLTVLEPVVDYIQIVDASGGLGNIVTTRTYSVEDTDDFYAAACNGTIGYLYDVSVTWESDAETVGDVTPTTGDSTTFEAQRVDIDSTCIVTAEYGSFTNTTGDLTVLSPRVDEIRIRDAPNGGGFPLTLEFFYIGNTSTYYAAGYNDTVDYLEDLAGAVWDITGGIGTVTSPGNSTTFTATTEGDGTITASYTYDSVTITEESGTIYVYLANLPPDPPGQPEIEDKGKDWTKMSWPANTEEDLLGYYIERTTDPDDEDSWEKIAFVDKNTTSFKDEDLDPDTKYSYRIVAVDTTFQESDPSPVVSATTEPEAFPWILLLLPIIIAIIVILLALLLWRKKKKEEEAKLPPEGAIPAAAPLEEAPPEAAPEEEYEYAPEEGYEEAPAEEYEEYEEAPSEEYEEEIFEEEPEEETTTPPPPPPPPPE